MQGVKSLFFPSGKSLLILLGLILLALFFGLSAWTSPLLIPLVISAIASATLGLAIIPSLRWLKTGQVIQEDGPQSHLKKAGTPTMGGVFFVPVAILAALLFSRCDPEVMCVSLVTLSYMSIGLLDDWLILKQQSNKGISPKLKLFLQITVAICFLGYSYYINLENLDKFTQIKFPFDIFLPLGIFFWPLAGFAMTAESNATNLTDGVDGLAGGTGAIAFLGLAFLVYPTHPNLAIFCTCFSGACLGFVVHNRHRAAVFMGDTGSLALGGSLAAVAIISNQLWGLFIISGIFFVESLSVIAQVIYYKATKGPDGKGKRLFKMAPLHHHLELSGWQETQVVGVFYLINMLLVIFSKIISNY